MKLFVFSDLHCNHKQLSNLEHYPFDNEQISGLVLAGDAVNMGEPVSFMEQFIKVIESIGKQFLWVPGNNDFGRAYHKLNARYKSLEGRIMKCGGQSFTGVGGSPASWAGQYQGENMIDQKEIAGTIFVSHYPPPANIKLFKFDVGNPKHEARNSKQTQNSNDKNSKQVSDFDLPAGEAGIRISNLPNGKRLVDTPLVHICGHLHYKWGTGFIGTTKIIQLASLETGHYAILDLETMAVKFKRF